MSQEVLEAGPERARRGLPAWVVWVLGIGGLVLITGGFVAVGAELTLRTVEADSLVRAVETSESAMKSTQDEFAEVLASYDTADLSDAEREKLLAELEDVAARGQESIAAAGEGVAAVQVMPWHANVRAAQEAYLAHNGAWADYMAAASGDPGEWFEPQPAVNDTFAQAKEPLVAAVPLFDLMSTLPRIELIYVTGSGESGDGQAA